MTLGRAYGDLRLVWWEWAEIRYLSTDCRSEQGVTAKEICPLQCWQNSICD